ncbi:MAG: TolC family protein [Oscillospiraceae bacterium]|jgi:hypothetical protein|nr:TolC family protein [Oscillospiraceae bacterium]
MKKGIALILTLALMAGVSIPAYAEDVDQTSRQHTTVEVSLNNIEDLMSSYNLNIKTYLNNLKTARDNKENFEDADDSDTALYYENQYDSAKIQYDENVANTILSAKQSYLAYCADNDRYAAAKTAAENAQKSYGTALASLSAGFISQQECDGLKDRYNQAQNSLTQLDSQLTQERAALRTLLNLPSNVSMSIKPVTADDVDFSKIPAIRYGADLIVMRGLSSKIKQAKLAYDYQEDTDDDFNSRSIQNAYIALQQARESEESTFKRLYYAMNNAYTVYQQDLDQVNRKQQELTVTKKALELGYSSQKSMDDKTSELKALQSTLAVDRNTLFTSYLSYINMKNGLSTGS